MDSDYFCKYRIISWLESDLYFDPETQFFYFIKSKPMFL